MNGRNRAGLTSSASVLSYRDGRCTQTSDDLATEEPLEIRLVDAAGKMQRAGVTMRTPGHDFELAAGFLYSEGIVNQRDDIAAISYCIDPSVDAAQQYNIVNVGLASRTSIDASRLLERHFFAGSACGVCGKASIEALRVRAQPITSDFAVPYDLLVTLPDRMREGQRVFASTGGLHAVALFDIDGKTLVVREDVGRHNAFDKVCGWALMNGRLPLDRCIAVVSGRASYELVQKCIVARIPILCAVSAPSSLAVELASEFNVTLAAFVRSGKANVYSAARRLRS